MEKQTTRLRNVHQVHLKHIKSTFLTHHLTTRNRAHPPTLLCIWELFERWTNDKHSICTKKNAEMCEDERRLWCRYLHGKWTTNKCENFTPEEAVDLKEMTGDCDDDDADNDGWCWYRVPDSVPKVKYRGKNGQTIYLFFKRSFTLLRHCQHPSAHRFGSLPHLTIHQSIPSKY